ncbi:hypothetical protein JCM10213_006347 [Rhodosporidiobolus nylandii]
MALPPLLERDQKNFEEKLAALEQKIPSLAFTTPEAKELARKALTHSSKSAVHNNQELAKLGETCSRAVLAKALYLSPGKHSSKMYGDQAAALASKPLSAIARELKLDEMLRVDKGVPYVSETMFQGALQALLGALELSSGNGALLQALKELGIAKLPEAPEPEGEGL